MNRVVVLMIMFIWLGNVFAGTVGGTFVFDCEEPETFFMAYAAVLTLSIIDTGTIMDAPYTPVSSPWHYEITSDFCDDSAYYAVGGIIITDMTSGNPMGIYPENPFHTVGGEADSINIVLDDTVDLNIIVNVIGGEFSDIMANIYDAIPAFVAGEDSTPLEMTVPIDDTFTVIHNVPSGPKYLQVFKDLNADGVWNDGEPNAYVETPESNLVFAVGGFYDTISVELDVSAISDKHIQMPKASIQCFPSPFNSALNIDFSVVGDISALEIIDVSGRTVLYRQIAGSGRFVWHPQNLPGGIYLLCLGEGRNRMVKRVAYIP